MTIEEFANGLYAAMENNLAAYNFKDGAHLQNSQVSLSIILDHISKLKSFVNNYTFTGIEEEIRFFKLIKPGFCSRFIYYQKVIFIQSHLPLATSVDIKNFYLGEIRKINEYRNTHHDFISYYRSGSTSLDEIYFVRKNRDSWLLLNLEESVTDLNFTTIYDYIIAKIIAYEDVLKFINVRLAAPEMQPGLPVVKKAANVSWTASKVSLVELLYALQSTGSCNNGTIDLKHLASHFEKLFNVELGNYYRIFQEMRIRKINRTTFLDQLKERLVQRMDEADNHPKFK